MKHFILVLVSFMMFVNSAFAMTGIIPVQSVNGVQCGMSVNEVTSKWGAPLKEYYGSYYFKPGGLMGDFFYSDRFKVEYLNRIEIKNNPNIVVMPSGISVGMTRAEIKNKLGEPDEIIFKYYDDGNSAYGADLLKYNTPDYVNFAELEGNQMITIYINKDTNRVTEIHFYSVFRR